MYANSHQFENHCCKSCVLTCRGMHACMQIQESTKGGYSMNISRGSGGMLWKNFEILMPRESFWCNLRLDARLETIKWPFLD